MTLELGHDGKVEDESESRTFRRSVEKAGGLPLDLCNEKETLLVIDTVAKLFRGKKRIRTEFELRNVKADQAEPFPSHSSALALRMLTSLSATYRDGGY